VNTQIFFQDLTALKNFPKAGACFRARAIIAAEIDKRLFPFKDGGRSDLVRLRAVGCDIRTIAAPRQADFHRARGITLRLRPE
jgi:hypothetical protein